MHEVESQPAQNNSVSELSPKKSEKRFSRLRSWLIAATVFLALAMILAGVLSSRQQESGGRPASPKQTVSQPPHSKINVPKPLVIPMPKGTPISSPVSSGYSLSMTIADDVAYIGTTNNAVYALGTSNGGLLWRSKINGSVNENPVVVDGIVYVSAYVGNSGPDTIYALRATDGTLLWHYTNNNDVYVDSPLVENGIAYVATENSIMAFSAGDGTLLWRYATNGYTSLAPQIINGVIYAGSGGDTVPDIIYALRASDGMLLWRYTNVGNIYLQTVTDGVAYVDAQDGTLTALRASDGHLLWQRKLVGSVYQFAFDNGVIYATTVQMTEPTSVVPGSDLFQQALSIGALLGNYSQNVPASPAKPLKQGLSSLYAIRVSDGAILWHYTMANGGNSWASSLAVDNGIVYASTNASTGNSASQGYVYALQSDSGSVLWQDTLGTSPSDALLATGVIYLSSDNGSYAGAVYALRAHDGSQLWSYPVSGPISQAPLLINSNLYLSAANGMVYALRSDNGSMVWHYQTSVDW